MVKPAPRPSECLFATMCDVGVELGESGSSDARARHGGVVQSHCRPRGRCAGPCKIFSHSARTTFSSGCLGLMMKGAEAWMGACHASQALLPRTLPLRFPSMFPCKIFSHSARTTFSNGCLGLSMVKGAEAWMGACHASQALLPRALPSRFPDHVSVQDMGVRHLSLSSP